MIDTITSFYAWLTNTTTAALLGSGVISALISAWISRNTTRATIHSAERRQNADLDHDDRLDRRKARAERRTRALEPYQNTLTWLDNYLTNIERIRDLDPFVHPAQPEHTWTLIEHQKQIDTAASDLDAHASRLPAIHASLSLIAPDAILDALADTTLLNNLPADLRHLSTRFNPWIADSSDPPTFPEDRAREIRQVLLPTHRALGGFAEPGTPYEQLRAHRHQLAHLMRHDLGIDDLRDERDLD